MIKAWTNRKIDHFSEEQINEKSNLKSQKYDEIVREFNETNTQLL